MIDDDTGSVSAATMNTYYSDAPELLARLDVETMRTSAYVETETPPNAVLSGDGFGHAVCGELSISEYGENGIHPAVSIGYKTGYIFTADFFSAARSISERDAKHAFESISRAVAFEGSGAVVDSLINPRLNVNYEAQTLTFPDGTVLREGDTITIDPASGGMWKGSQNIVLVPDLDNLSSTLRGHVCPYDGLPKLTGHLGGELSIYDVQMFSFPAAETFSGVYNATLDAGLVRTETFVRRQIEKELNRQEPNAYGFPIHALQSTDLLFLRSKNIVFRLPDFNGLRDLMSPNMQSDLDKGDDHKPKTNIFQYRELLYLSQIRSLERYLNDRITREFHHYTFLLPSVENADEVSVLKERILGGFSYKVGFGVMMETRAALENTCDIAPLCDRLSYGTNDLAAAFTDFLRENWMDACDERRKNPFKVLTSEVLEPMAESIKIAREVNPQVIISCLVPVCDGMG